MTLRQHLLWFLPVVVGCGDTIINGTDETQEPGIIDLGKVGVITGDFDRVEELLDLYDIPFILFDGWVSGPPSNALLAEDYDHDLPRVEDLLTDTARLQTYDVVFINCGVRGLGTFDPTTLAPSDELLQNDQFKQTLESYVSGGGVLVVTDQSYNALDVALPEVVSFLGDGSVGDALVGEAGVTTTLITDQNLAQAVGSNNLPITLTSHFAVMSVEEVGALEGTITLVSEGTLPGGEVDVPLLTLRPYGRGLVVFTSFHLVPEVDEAHMQLLNWLLYQLAEAL